MSKELFFKACEFNNITMVNEFISPELINSLDERGNTPLIIAVRNSSYDVALLLINYGANLDIKNKIDSSNTNLSLFSEYTALMYASFNENIALMNLLIDRGADLTITNDKNKTALDIAIDMKRFTSIATLNKDLINKPADINGNTLVMLACKQNIYHRVSFLIEKGADLFIKNNDGESVLDVLNSISKLEPGLEALKEKLMLNQLFSEEDEICARL